jgi:hypothetical protein
MVKGKNGFWIQGLERLNVRPISLNDFSDVVIHGNSFVFDGGAPEDLSARISQKRRYSNRIILIDEQVE